MWEIHQASGWGVNFWGVGSVGNVGSVGKSMIFQHSQCFQCFQCSKKRGTPLKNPPLLRTQFAPNTAQGAHKLHKGETARQGRQHSAGGAHKLHEGDTARQERQLRKAGTRAAGSQKLRLWRSRSSLWNLVIMALCMAWRYKFVCSCSLRK